MEEVKLSSGSDDTLERSMDQSIALNKITLQLLKDRAEDCKRLWVALVISILVNLAIVGFFLIRESQWEYETTTAETTTTEITQEVEGEGAEIHNIAGNQYNDNATHNDGGDN